MRCNRGDGVEEAPSLSAELAQQLYRMWHEKSPEQSFHHELDPPEEVYAVGEATHILYESDKWEEDGNYFRYIHKFDSRPTLYASDGAIFPEDVEPYDVVKTTKLMGVTKFTGEYGFPVLANVLSLTFDDGSRKRKIKFKSYHPVMSCSTNQRTLVIFAETLLFVNGGQMVVSAPGIID